MFSTLYLNTSIDIIVVLVLFMQSFLEESISLQTCWNSVSYDLSAPSSSSHSVLWSIDSWAVLQMYPLILSSPKSLEFCILPSWVLCLLLLLLVFLVFVFVFVYMMAPIFHKRKLLWREWYLQLSLGIRTIFIQTIMISIRAHTDTTNVIIKCFLENLI